MRENCCAFYREVCEVHFGRGKPCLGCPEAERDALAAEPEFLVSQTPVPRKISAACQKVIGEDARDASINQVYDQVFGFAQKFKRCYPNPGKVCQT